MATNSCNQLDNTATMNFPEGSKPVRLKRPTDFLILEHLENNGRNVAANIAIEIDKKRSYVNTRLPVLEDYKLITKIGPSERSGLYEITALGSAALENRDSYGNDGVDFDELIQKAVEIGCEDSGDDDRRANA